MTHSNKRMGQWLPLLPVVLAIFLYVPTLGYDFVYDDHWTVAGNPHLRVWPGLQRIFTSDIWGLTSYPAPSNYYRPMFFLGNWFTAHVMSASPWAFHLMNLLLHAVAAGLVWLVAMNLVADKRIALIAATLFAVHPIHTEAVAWITDTVDLGCTLFFLLAVFLYTRAGSRRLTTEIAISACYFVALLWKEPAATFVLVIVAFDWLIRGELQWRRYAPIAFVTGIYFLMRYQALGGVVPITYHSTLTLSEYPLVAATGLGTYISKLMVPINLSMYYDPVADSLLFAGLLGGLIVTAVLLSRRWREISWALFWIVLTLSPALAVSRISMPVSERNLYLASVGYCLAIAILVSKLNWRYASVLSAVVAGLFAVGTLQRLPVWQDDLTLYAATLRKHPDASIVRMNLATELARRARLPEAIEQLDIVLATNPSETSVLSNKALLKSRQGDWQAVSEICSKALSVDANMVPCITLSAVADQQRGDLTSALQKLDRAIDVAPHSYEAHYYRGNVYSQMRRFDAAISEYEQAFASQPTAETLNNLGSTYFQIGQIDKAIESYRNAVQLDPDFSLAKENLEALLKWRHDQSAEVSPAR
jgi:protein O-mannosyl-transferase